MEKTTQFIESLLFYIIEGYEYSGGVVLSTAMQVGGRCGSFADRTAIGGFA